MDISTNHYVRLTVEPPAPVASFNASTTNGVVPLTVTFTNISTGWITNWFWNFGDTSTTNFAVATNAVHTYNAAGTNTVTLTVSGPGGTNTSTLNYVVATNPPPPSASFSGTPTSGLAPLPVTFTDGSTGAISNWFWDFGDTTTTNFAASTNPVHTYNAGTYTVSLTVSGLGGANTSTHTGYIVATNPAPPVANFSGTPTNGLAPLAVTFTDNSTGTISNWFWDFGDTTTTNFAVSTNPVHTYNAGTYTVSLTVSGLGGANTSTHTGYIVATNLAPPVASFSGTPTNGPAPLLVTFTDSSSGTITNRHWSFGDGATTNTTLSSSLGHRYNAAGTNTVGLTVFGPGGSNTMSRIHYIIVTSTNAAPDTTPPVLTVLSPVNYQTFTNAATNVTGTASDASGIRSVTVNGVGATLSGTNWSEAITLSLGTNTITVIATDNSANMNTATQVVHAILNPVIPTNHPPQITAGLSVTNALLQIGTNAVVVADETNTFTVSATDADGDTLNYQWVFGDGASTNTTIGPVSNVYTIASVEHVYTNDCGPYHASVTVSDGHASTNSDLTVVVACQMQITKLQLNLNFAKTNADSCTVKGKFELPASYSFTNRLATLDIGGAEVSFTLPKKGSGHIGSSTFSKPTYNKRTGLWTFSATLKKGFWQSPWWADYSMINSNIPRPGVSVTNFPVILVLDTEAFMGTTNLNYTAKHGKSGTAKSAK